MDSRPPKRVVEATAPACIELAGGIDFGPRRSVATEPAVCVAIDRRALCRVETGHSGLRVESKDTLFRGEGRDVSALLAAGCPALVPSILRRLGIDSGLSITTHSRVPPGAGLGDAALAVAAAAAVLSAVGADMGKGAVWQLARDALAGRLGAGPQRLHGAIQGGVLGFHIESGDSAGRLAIDPGRVEESLLLVDTGGLPAPDSGVPGQADRGGLWDGSADTEDEGQGEAELAAVTRSLGEALIAYRLDGIGELVARQWDVLKRLNPAVNRPEVERVVEIARAAGGGARACSGAPGGWTLVWAPPGERREGSRERVEAGLREAGLRILSFRVDLRGLEVED